MTEGQEDLPLLPPNTTNFEIKIHPLFNREYFLSKRFKIFIFIKFVGLQSKCGHNLSMLNRTPEPLTKDNFDGQLIPYGWVIQDKGANNLSLELGIAVREYQNDVGPADYVLFVEGKPVGVIEAKREGEALTAHESHVEESTSRN